LIQVCILLVAVVLVVGLSATLLAAALDRTKKQLATAEQRLEQTTAALHRQRELLTSTEARLAETSASLAEMTARHNEAHSDRQLLLAEAGAHRAVEMAARIPGLTDEERRAIAAKLEVAKANSPRVRIL
jgi:septal ring factor EnvC (AmiA/AmiB activator)